MRRIGGIALLLAACSGGPAPTPTHAPRPTPESLVRTPPPPTTNAADAPPSIYDIATARARLADARNAVTAQDYLGARMAFGEVLHIVPDEPRLLCESGFVQHLAARPGLAAAQMDAALAGFAPGATGDALATCLARRAIVDAAAGDFVSAVDDDRDSLALGPDAAVQTHLNSMQAHVSARPTSGTMGGVNVDVSPRSLLVHASGRVYLESAIRVGMSGRDENGQFVLRNTEVRTLAEHAQVVVYGIHTPELQYDADYVVVSHAERGGFRVVVGTRAVVNDEAADRTSFDDAVITDVGPYVRIDAVAHDVFEDETLDDGSEAPHCWRAVTRRDDTTHTLLCRITPSFACVRVGGAVANVNDTVEGVCIDQDGHAIDRPIDPAPARASYELSIAAGPDGRITLAVGSGTPPPTALVGTFTFATLLADEAHTHIEAATGHTDRERAALDETTPRQLPRDRPTP